MNFFKQLLNFEPDYLVSFLSYCLFLKYHFQCHHHLLLTMTILTSLIDSVPIFKLAHFYFYRCYLEPYNRFSIISLSCSIVLWVR